MTVVAIVGSRDFPELDRVKSFVRSLAVKHPGATVVSGGARGVDRVAEQEAHRQGLLVLSLRPEITVEGDRRAFAQAAKKRNTKIVREADHVIAFWDGRSYGTSDTIGKARRAGKLRAVRMPRAVEENERAVLAAIEQTFGATLSEP